MRYSYCPIVFLNQTELGLSIKVNGFNVGYNTLVFYKKDKNGSKKSIDLTSDKVFIAAKEFSAGKGDYCFYLKDDISYTPTYTIYVFCNKKENDFKRILESIVNPEDAKYMLNKIHGIKKISETYTKTLVDIYRKIKNKQDSEVRNFSRLINATERYENSLTVYMNRSIIKKPPISYEKNYSLFINDEIITYIKLYSIDKDGIKRYLKEFYPSDISRLIFDYDTFYLIDFFIDGEIALELIHYEPDKDGSKYLWSLYQNNIDHIKQIDKTFYEIGYSDISPEDAKRIVQEKKKENIDAFMPRLIVKQSIYHDSLLSIEILDYDLLKKMKKDFYISIREPDQLFDKTFSKRYKITDSKMTLNAAAEFLSGEIILFIEDENQIIVSPITRLDLEDPVCFGEMHDYVTKRSTVEIEEYVESYIEHLRSVATDGEYLSNLSNIIRSQAHDSDITPEKMFYNILIKSATSSYLNKYADNLIYFTFTDWTGRHNIDGKFFDKKPRFVNALDTFIFPVSEEIYVLVVEKIVIDKNVEPKINKTFYASSPEQSVSVNIAKGDMFLIYAIDSRTYKRSGAILVNNIGQKEYYKNQIELEALANA